MSIDERDREISSERDTMADPLRGLDYRDRGVVATIRRYIKSTLRLGDTASENLYTNPRSHRENRGRFERDSEDWMSREPEDLTGSFIVGVLFEKLKIATREDITQAVEYQREASAEELIGEILIANGVISREQLHLVLELQQKLRSRSRTVRAMAAADIADMTRGKVISFAERMRKASEEIRRQTTGTGHPAITSNMLETEK